MQEIREALEKTAEDLGATGRDNSFGHGLVQADRALRFLKNNDDSCHLLHLKTSNEQYSESATTFHITGYGDIPAICHNKLGAECDISVCGVDSLEIKAKGTDGWKFTITGDIGDLIDYTTVNGGQHFPPFPTWMDTDQFDFVQKYKLRKNNHSARLRRSLLLRGSAHD